jgi:hypothetical protein
MKTKSSPATAVPVAPAAGLKRINLAGIATTAPAAKAAKTYPELPDPDGQVAALVEGILEMSEQVEALSGALEISKGELIAIAKPFYFAHHAGQMAVASSVEAKSGDKLVRVGFSNSYRGTTDDAAILRVTGESRNRWDRLRQTAFPAQPHFAGRQTGRDADQRSLVIQAIVRAQDQR